MWVKQKIILPPVDDRDEDELDRRLEKARIAKKKRPERGKGLYSTS